jgi:hypothetical protein
MALHAELAAVRIHLRQHDDVPGPDDAANLRRRKRSAAEPDAFAIAIGAQQAHAEVHQDVRAAPLPSVRASGEADRRLPGPRTLADAEGVDLPLLPREMRQRDPFEVAPVVLLADHHRGLHFLGGQVAAAPDDVAVAAAPEARLHRAPSFLLAMAIGDRHRLDWIDEVALPLQPLDLRTGCRHPRPGRGRAHGSPRRQREAWARAPSGDDGRGLSE